MPPYTYLHQEPCSDALHVSPRASQAHKTKMEEDWLTQLLDAQGMPMGVIPGHGMSSAAQMTSGKNSQRKGNANKTYITPPMNRKADAAAAVAPVRAVAVVATKVAQPVPEVAPTPAQPVQPFFVPQPPTVAQPPPPSDTKPIWDQSTSCVPKGAAWVTTVPPPRREKRVRKVRHAHASPLCERASPCPLPPAPSAALVPLS